ncbi:NAD(+)--dinitrogen-reductase ADP-D-ribosyltransferase [Geoalkalibacter halelectricus]|uniref:NAD(+)--dinitrogen-reductase ADP-D-ribosyltransferase n=1 Tax=Geoalkalibacter halelectricus TaxID=2847045 RepID=A0ABY5ZLN8_9BACT|nr:NAD(+)--dinitrogen-reductase ADP-D-ribosyltransferase [Geoalkalibacter halelectricus]MDO3378632.1 NAD(+)--dinitrogen-reductase ADP-D-ribosyltransferase [Geoalkalibacter halelectricus]UWZ80056.1 NAD(+)--dinitrogen-reductase ADP-D-ribosyltransferase [Geoalkalibacter halelectricus]
MRPAAMNLCNLPPWVIASRHFNAHPQPLEIQGVRQANPLLFERLAALDDAAARALQFHDYMDVTFQLHQWQQETSAKGRKSLKNSYLRFLRGWMFDSNALEGAVLKGWVESRFGLPPTFHKEPISDLNSHVYYQYLVDRMKGAARTNAINSQFDVLFEFVQQELASRYPRQMHLTLYRGVYDFHEYPLVEALEKNRCVVRLNNLNSFTSDFERAWEFGSKVMKARVPRAKIFYQCGILPSSLLKGEEEVLVLGGEYEIEVVTGGFG